MVRITPPVGVCRQPRTEQRAHRLLACGVPPIPSRADDPDAYLRRILINTSHRRFRRHRVTEQPGDPPETAVEGPADLVGERTALLAALRQLPPRQRAVVVLRYWEDLTDAQIGAALGCSPGTVRSQLSRALAKLRDDPALGEGEER